MGSNPRRSFHQKVSSETLNWRHFLVVVVHSSIVDKKLGIPFLSDKRYGKELSDVVSITIPNGCVWKLGIGKSNKRIWLDNGWPEFVEFYSIRRGNVLVFKYKGVSCFDVRIYNTAACEIEYPCKLKTKCDEELEKETRTVSGRHGHGTYLSTSKEAENPIEAAKMFKTAGPSFTMVVRSYNINRQIGYLPKKFSDHLKCSRFLKLQLQVSDGSAWSVRAVRSENSTAGLYFSAGFSDFLKDNNLEEGDAIAFELIVSEPVVLKASIFRASDFRSGQGIKSFVKVILQSALDLKKLGIPNAFVRRYGQELGDVATVTLSNGKVWKLGLTKTDGEIWFDSGFLQFVENHSICHSNFLIFKYNGVSCFDVIIFDKTAHCEVQYPCNGAKPGGDKGRGVRKQCSLSQDEGGYDVDDESSVETPRRESRRSCIAETDEELRAMFFDIFGTPINSAPQAPPSIVEAEMPEDTWVPDDVTRFMSGEGLRARHT